MRCTNVVAVLASAVSFVVGAALDAQEQAVVPIRRAVPLDSAGRASKASATREIAALRNSSPAAFDSLRSMIAFSRQMQLARMGYAAGPFDIAVSSELVAAIRSYERDRGLAITGDPLSFELGRSLDEDERFFADEPFLPMRMVVGDAEYIQVRGAWTFPDMGEQHIAVEIACDRRARTCFESQAILRSDGFGPSLSTDQQQWSIGRWDSVEIATEPVDFVCARYALRINLVQKTATKVRSTISNTATCSHQNRDDLVITLRDGAELDAERSRARLSAPFPARVTPRASETVNSRARPTAR
jgi:peptidoglycan hydrolase-like protein with peptidoglycan-binding domain